MGGQLGQHLNWVEFDVYLWRGLLRCVRLRLLLDHCLRRLRGHAQSWVRDGLIQLVRGLLLWVRGRGLQAAAGLNGVFVLQLRSDVNLKELLVRALLCSDDFRVSLIVVELGGAGGLDVGLDLLVLRGAVRVISSLHLRFQVKNHYLVLGRPLCLGLGGRVLKLLALDRVRRGLDALVLLLIALVVVYDELVRHRRREGTDFGVFCFLCVLLLKGRFDLLHAITELRRTANHFISWYLLHQLQHQLLFSVLEGDSSLVFRELAVSHELFVLAENY